MCLGVTAAVVSLSVCREIPNVEDKMPRIPSEPRGCAIVDRRGRRSFVVVPFALWIMITFEMMTMIDSFLIPAPSSCSLVRWQKHSTDPSGLFSERNDGSEDYSKEQSPSSTTTKTTTKTPLSDVDARVLRAMLNDKNTLDLDTADDIRKLLDRGVVKTTPSPKSKNNNDTNDESSSAYSSQVIKTLSDTKIWKKLSRNANDIWESVGIWITNKVESDVKVLAALGIFAWDRAVRDVARALPSSSTWGNRKQLSSMFLLSNTSSYDYQEALRRPQDEIRGVSKQVMDILSGKVGIGTSFSSDATGTINNDPSRRSSNRRRGLRTVAPAGRANAAERQRRAYESAKRQQANREQNVAVKVGTGLIDTAWELQQELGSEINRPGYKTEPVRRALAQGVQNTEALLRAAQDRARLVAAEQQRQKQQQQAEFQLEKSSSVDMVEETKKVSTEKEGKGFPTEQSASTTTTTYDQSSFEDVVDYFAVDIKEIRVDKQQQSKTSNEQAIDGHPYLEQRNEQTQRNEPLDVSGAVDTNGIRMGTTSSENTRIPTLQELELLEELELERERIANQLQKCIRRPDQTWLRPQVVDAMPDKRAIMDGTGMQQTITKMVLLKDQILSEEDPASVEEALRSLLRLRDSTEDLCQFMGSFVSEILADELRAELLEEDSDSEELPLISRLEEFEAISSLSSTASSEVAEDAVENNFNQVETPIGRNTETERFRYEATEAVAIPETQTPFVVEPALLDATPTGGTCRVLDVIPDAVVLELDDSLISKSKVTDAQASSNVYAEQDKMDAVAAELVAEIITDEAFDSAVGGAKVAVEVTADDLGNAVEEKEEMNVVIKITLRSLDVIFFIVEKVLLVGVPGTVRVVSTAIRRVEEVNREGRGTQGWKQIRNLADTKGRY